jgi:hypothetical protein
LKLALKGCFAASLCYIIYTSIAWPGISTAVTTCLLTALSTIGASRQKLILRFAGALVGGFLIGMGSQMFILPYLDSISGFTVLFVVVTGLVPDIQPSVVILRIAARSGFLPHQPAGVRHADIALHSKRPRRWDSAWTVHDVACL